MNTINTIIAIAIGIQSGASTHHHDQSILSVSFKTMNTMPKTVDRLIPEDDDWLDMINYFQDKTMNKLLHDIPFHGTHPQE